MSQSDIDRTELKRRTFLAGMAASAVWPAIEAKAATVTDIPIIDTHIHLFDATRPQGAPYTGSKAYQGGISLPPIYRALAEPLGIVGAVVLEAGPWVEDNLWVLQVAQTDTMMVGYIGDLQPEKPEFNEYFDRYRKNPLWRGIRYGNNWGYNIADQIGNPALLAGLKRVADADLVFEVANPRMDLFQSVITVSDRIPELRIVLDHLPGFEPSPNNQALYDAFLREVHGRPNIIAKMSEIDHRVNGVVVAGLQAHQDRLDMLMGIFGEDRVLFGTDWPNSIGSATPEQIVTLSRAYFASRSHGSAEKYFWKNSARIYKWIKRAPNQPGPVSATPVAPREL